MGNTALESLGYDTRTATLDCIEVADNLLYIYLFINVDNLFFFITNYEFLYMHVHISYAVLKFNRIYINATVKYAKPRLELICHFLLYFAVVFLL